MWDKLLFDFLNQIVRRGRLTLVLHDGRARAFGDGQGAGSVKVTVKDADLARKVVLGPDMAVGEAYMDGRLEIENDDLHGFFALILSNMSQTRNAWWQAPLALSQRAMRRVAQANPIGKAQRNIAHHYDLSGELYDLFLDEDRQYSCAYFEHPDMTLDAAQAAKKRHIANKLLIEPGMRVLDIGCGWGGMALTLAREHGAEVVGVTLSKEQHAVATSRAEAAGLADKVDFRLCDYRNVTESFDRIVSVGMFEHVGVPHYREYFDTVERLLTPDGIALIHTIGREKPPGVTSPFIQKYIFPGGYVPAMSEMSAAIERTGLWKTDIEVWRLHYATTLRHWFDRFSARIDEARAIYDDRFCRMWRYYLAAAEMTFRHDGQVVYQVQLARRQDAVPLTRDYMAE
ncbi:cyclopropane-fatty-acyl-phospholipid synthase family protein [Pseudooceanicola sp.]|uniref:SAM-dependent methyltransferase n=1 Tax=Pseudooceanicola sp. TaxID=1914328 RepID=UPI002630DE5F|nr:cyclopropane-fatty-acyl-phospholipid synthase family protein [Pseudooceanicola sp.]MDF1856851.1 cyclopropane-fatty-acyl-phospholipid synthase [Pseudooceanicola sp.]